VQSVPSFMSPPGQAELFKMSGHMGPGSHFSHTLLFSWWYWGLNSRLHTCLSRHWPLEPCFQPSHILLFYLHLHHVSLAVFLLSRPPDNTSIYLINLNVLQFLSLYWSSARIHIMGCCRFIY
jgi:hypothetical protein